MGMLDYGEFGTSKLGYQDQLRDLPADLIQAMQVRAQREKAQAEASYRNAEIAHKNQELQLRQNEYNDKKKTESLKDAGELQKEVHALLAAGDTEGAKALIAARGGQVPQTPAAAPPPAEDLSLGDLAPPEVTDEAQGLLGPNAEPPAAAPQNPTEPPPFDPSSAGDIHLGEELPPKAPPEPKASPLDLLDAVRSRAKPRAGDMPVVRPDQVDSGMSVQRPANVDPGMVSRGTQVAGDVGTEQSPRTVAQFTYTTPDGRTISLDAEQVRSGEMRRRAKEFYDAEIEQAKALHQSAAGQPPEVAAATRREAKKRMEDAARLRAHIESGAVAVKEAGVQAELGIRGRATQEAEDARNRYTQSQANYRAQLMANRREVDQATKEADKDRTQSRQEAQYVDSVTKDFRDHVVGLIPKDLAKYRELRTSVDKIKGNPLEQKAALYALGKEINGPGVFTNQDRNDILNYGGLYDKIGNWFSQLQDGTLSDEYAGIAAQAIDHQLKKVKARVDAASADWDERFNDDPDLQTPEAKARLAVRKKGLFGAWGLPQNAPVPQVPPGAAVIGSRANPSGRSLNHTSSTRTKTKGPTGDEVEDFLNGH